MLNRMYILTNQVSRMTTCSCCASLGGTSSLVTGLSIRFFQLGQEDGSAFSVLLPTERYGINTNAILQMPLRARITF